MLTPPFRKISKNSAFPSVGWLFLIVNKFVCITSVVFIQISKFYLTLQTVKTQVFNIGLSVVLLTRFRALIYWRPFYLSLLLLILFNF